tara:strand:- start:601 stop:873 length:273 start_codon:yes stop_codon:yes gene_type:complete
MEEENKSTEKQCDIHVATHRLLTELDFTKCSDGKYRRCNIHDFMNVKIDDYGYMCISAELEHKPIEIQITMIRFEDRYKFKDWLLFTYGA